MSTRSYRGEIEGLIPTLRRCARALADGRDGADDLVHDSLTHALKAERTWSGEDVSVRLFSRLVGANRSRVRSAVAERRPAPTYPIHLGGGRTAASATGSDEPRDDLFAGLSLNEREVIVLVVLGGLDYSTAAQALGLPAAVLVTRMVQARGKLGDGPWSGRAVGAGPSRTAAHLRLVKS